MRSDGWHRKTLRPRHRQRSTERNTLSGGRCQARLCWWRAARAEPGTRASDWLIDGQQCVAHQSAA
jgi:hypothetical protein